MSAVPPDAPKPVQDVSPWTSAIVVGLGAFVLAGLFVSTDRRVTWLETEHWTHNWPGLVAAIPAGYLAFVTARARKKKKP